MGQARPTVFIVDDEPNCAEATRLVLERAGYATQWFASAEEFLAEVTGRERGCVLLDLIMLGMNGFQVQNQLNARGVRLPIVFLSGYGTVAHSVEAMRNGACDFLEKPFQSDVLLAAVERALAVGEVEADRSREREELARRHARLTGREQEVLDLVVRGHTNREVGELLHISEKTVKVHRSRVKAKMQVDNLPELVLAAQALGRI